MTIQQHGQLRFWRISQTTKEHIMKKTLNIALLICIMSGLVFMASCKSINVTDPNSPTQKIAADAGKVLDAVKDIAPAVAPFVPSPIKEALLLAIAAVGGVVGAVQKLKAKKAETATSEIVMGLESAKKNGAIPSMSELAVHMNAAQSVATKKIVDKLQS